MILARRPPKSPPRKLRRQAMVSIFGADLPPTMTVGELRRELFERDDLLAAPSTIALVRGHWGHRWMEEHDPVLTDVLMNRLSNRHGGSHAS